MGKGVCFDSGGISIKQAEGMGDMKHDKAGAAAVIAAARTVARLAPETPLMAVAPMVENMPGGNAQRPGDVVTAMNGETVEVTNTDAEGRLILADALTWAEQPGGDAPRRHGDPDRRRLDRLRGAGEPPTSRAARLGRAVPHAAEATRGVVLGDAAGDASTGPRSTRRTRDIVNSGSRDGSLIKSAVFISEFVTRPWVHVDIAGAPHT